MDAFTKISYYFPCRCITIFQIAANIIISNESECQQQDRNLVISLLVIASLACFFSCFTDVFTSINNQKFIVFILPYYGPICNSLPSEGDKDRLYRYYFFKGHDLIHAILASIAFFLITIFINPVCMCLFPSGLSNGTSRIDSSLIRSIPVIVALIIALMVICLGPPRQLIGFSNVPDTYRPNNFGESDSRSVAVIQNAEELPIDAAVRKSRREDFHTGGDREDIGSNFEHPLYIPPYSHDEDGGNSGVGMTRGLPSSRWSQSNNNSGVVGERMTGVRGSLNNPGLRSSQYQ
mmetsp:Transcript_4083/g.7264  ORF Transcript_4083/g.7264 Transcript_4083/m.7264 type:complete len:292 (+) Transcript_4083:161-1036(+)